MIFLTLTAVFAILALGLALVYEKHQNGVREKEWALERGALLTRIQTPELAPAIGTPEPAGEVLHVPYDDDAAFDSYIERRSAGMVN